MAACPGLVQKSRSVRVIPVLFPGTVTAAEDVCGTWLNQSEFAVLLVQHELAAAGMFASGMFQQSSLGNKRSGAGITRVSSSHFFPPGPGSGSRAGSVRSDSLSSISSDPEYIMQLVSDVRKFADVLLHLKEAFNSKGELLSAEFYSLFVMIKKLPKFSCLKDLNVLKIMYLLFIIRWSH